MYIRNINVYLLSDVEWWTGQAQITVDTEQNVFVFRTPFTKIVYNNGYTYTQIPQMFSQAWARGAYRKHDVGHPMPVLFLYKSIAVDFMGVRNLIW